MPISVIVGGQFGSEGKGKTAHYWAQTRSASVAVRVGGSNSGHTAVNRDGKPTVLRQLPTAALLAPAPLCVLPAGSYIDLDVLISELDRTGLAAENLLIDPKAVIITPAERDAERDAGLKGRVGSTLSGTGAAVMRRISRDGTVRLARDEEKLSRFLGPAASRVRERLSSGERVVIEGTQGFGLSLLHAEDYPYATSRDTTAAAFVAEAGLSPLDVDEVVLVLRAFPIRVADNSGPLPNETTWEAVTAESGGIAPLQEFTSVTGRLRRVARFDAAVVRCAIEVNAPTHVVMNHLDYIDSGAYDAEPTREVLGFVRRVEGLIGREVDYIGTGPASLFARSSRLRLGERAQIGELVVD